MHSDGSEEVQRALHCLGPGHEYADSRIVMQDAYDNDNTCFVRTPNSVLSNYQREIRATDASASPYLSII